MRTDVVVLGAGIVGTSVALQLAKRGLAVALVDKRDPGEETSFGNAGMIEGETLFPHAFPNDLMKLARIAAWRAPDANYHLTYLPRVASWLLAYRSWSTPERLLETAKLTRPMFAQAVPEHEMLMEESGATQLLHKTGWLRLYRSQRSFDETACERQTAESYGVRFRVLDANGALALEPALSPVFRHAVMWDDTVSVTNPLALTQAYARRFTELGGHVVKGDALSLRYCGIQGCRVRTSKGILEAGHAVIALGPWTNDLLRSYGLRLPLAAKRGYHRHYKARGNATLSRPVLDADIGYVLAPMEQGIRLTTGAEFADRDAPPTPVQIDRVLPSARELFPLGEGIEPTPWMGSRPCLPDSRPVIGQTPNHPWLWIASGHAHWGLTLGPATGRLIAEMMTGATPFCDPKPYHADRFRRGV